MAGSVSRPPGGRRIGEASSVSKSTQKRTSPKQTSNESSTSQKPKLTKAYKKVSSENIEDEKKPRSKKDLAIIIGLQVVGLIFLIGAFSISVIVGLQAKPFDEAIQSGIVEFNSLEAKVNQISDEIAGLPNAGTAKRWAESSYDHGEAVAKRQNALMSEIVELSYEDIPEDYNVIGERDPVKYTEEERKAMAEDARDSRMKGYLRELASSFGMDDADQRGFVASGPWFQQLGIEPAKGRVWTYSAPGIFDKDGAIPVSWTMVDADGQKIAVVIGNYDSERKVFTDLEATRLLEKPQEEVAK